MSAAIEEEEEILLSIFPEEFTKVNETTFKIRIDIDPSETKVKSPPTIYLTAQLPSKYPDVEPILHIESVPSSEAGGGNDDVSGGERDTLVTKLYVLAEENLGMSMIFTLVSALKEDVVQLLDDRITRLEDAKAARAAAVEREEQKRFEGTKVTPESFHAWNEKFKLEMARKKIDEDEALKRQILKAGGSVDRKLTGRQLFEGDQSLAQSDLKIGESTDVEFDFSKFDKTTRSKGEEEDEEEVRHWAAE